MEFPLDAYPYRVLGIALLGILIALATGGGTLSLKNHDECLYTTEDLHASNDTPVGVFARIRSSLDQKYHNSYSQRRQRWQDSVLLREWERQQELNETKASESPFPQPWIIFTAGVMGAGKSHTIVRLDEMDLLPRHRFIVSDPDVFRQQMPEFRRYKQACPELAGIQTRKEAGMMSEILVKYALSHGKSVLQDGTLRDWQWYHSFIQDLRRLVPGIRVGILHVTAPLDIILERSKHRALETGRVVPEHLLRENFHQVPFSVQQLSPYVDTVVEIRNEDDVALSIPVEEFRSLWQ